VAATRLLNYYKRSKPEATEPSPGAPPRPRGAAVRRGFDSRGGAESALKSARLSTRMVGQGRFAGVGVSGEARVLKD
jgi:hypothetical protein